MVRRLSLLPLAALLFAFCNPASAGTQESIGKCVANSYPATGDLSLARVVPSDDAEFPCQFEMQDAKPARGQFRYFCYGCLGRPEPLTGYTKAPIRLMTLLVKAPEDPGIDTTRLHKTSFFGVRLSDASELRLAVHNNGYERKLEVGLLDTKTLVAQPLGWAPIDGDGDFQVVLEQSNVLQNLRAYVWSGETRLQIDVPKGAGGKNLDEWSFGLLNDREADNLVKYTLKLRNGPVPAIDEYGSR